jgi:hypothetical protein
MSSTIATDIKTPADIIALSKTRRLGGQTESGSERQAHARGRALTLPEDVVTFSSQLTDSDTPPLAVSKMASLPVTPSEKKALLGSDTPPFRLSIYG